MFRFGCKCTFSLGCLLVPREEINLSQTWGGVGERQHNILARIHNLTKITKPNLTKITKPNLTQPNKT